MLPHKKFFLFILALILLSSLESNSVYASSFKLEIKDVDINQYQNTYKDINAEENSQNESSSYILRGFINSNLKEPFTLSSSNDLIDFGIISPTDPITRFNTINVLKGSSLGYSVFVFEDHELKDEKTNEIIPNTSCDNGACSESLSSSWDNTLTFGYGYNCKGNSLCLNEFLNSNYYKAFAVEERNQKSEAIIQELYKDKPQKVDLIYKVNISGTQKPGVYKNNITYIAVPNF